jgi:hypothetical protein
MTDMTPQTGSTPRFERGHSPIDDVNLRTILSFTGGLIVFVLVVCYLLTVLEHRWRASAQLDHVARSPLLQLDKGQYPGPSLQDNPARDLPQHASEAEKKLDEYEWVVPDEVARIPIKRAMEIIAERGVGANTNSSDDLELKPDNAIRRARERAIGESPSHSNE